jgi:hypothetical protein
LKKKVCSDFLSNRLSDNVLPPAFEYWKESPEDRFMIKAGCHFLKIETARKVKTCQTLYLWNGKK